MKLECLWRYHHIYLRESARPTLLMSHSAKYVSLHIGWIMTRNHRGHYRAVATGIRQKYLPGDSKAPGSQRSIGGDQRSRTPSPVSPNQWFHSRTNVFAVQPLPPTRTIVVRVYDMMYAYMSNFNVLLQFQG